MQEQNTHTVWYWKQIQVCLIGPLATICFQSISPSPSRTLPTWLAKYFFMAPFGSFNATERPEKFISHLNGKESQAVLYPRSPSRSSCKLAHQSAFPASVPATNGCTYKERFPNYIWSNRQLRVPYPSQPTGMRPLFSGGLWVFPLLSLDTPQ